MQRVRSVLKKGINEISVNALNLLKWFVFAGLTGVIVGGVSVAFHKLDFLANNFRDNHLFIVLFLPLAGLFITFIYNIAGGSGNVGGTNQVIKTIQAKDEIPPVMAPLIFVSTITTHLFGGSVGREGAALQLGSSLAAGLGKLKFLKLRDEDRRIIIMCGMSAAFSAIFGTPLAAVFFPMEVISVGIIHYSALFPCFAASLVASELATFCGVGKEAFDVLETVPITPGMVGLVALLSVITALVSIVFCLSLGCSTKLFKRIHKNPYVRAVIGGIVFVAVNALLGTTDYLGAGMNVIERVVHEPPAGYAFLIKLLLTALCIGAGYKGGEIVPSLFIGATLGSAFGSLVGIPVPLAAACGMAAMFVGCTNCPVTTLLIISELFGFNEGSLYFLLAITISYIMSGYFGLYSAQNVIYSKFRTKYINRKTGAYDPELEE